MMATQCSKWENNALWTSTQGSSTRLFLSPSLWVAELKIKYELEEEARCPRAGGAAPAPRPRSWSEHSGPGPAPVREDMGSFFALTTGSLRQGISHSCSSIIWMAFKKRNVPQRSGFNNAPALSALGCAPQSQSKAAHRGFLGPSSWWHWPWDHLHCKNGPLSGALTLTALTWHISNRILEFRSRCCPDQVFNSHFSHRGGSIPAMLGSHFWGPTTS